MELVSIVTPAYNAARFISTTIESVRKQTYPHWEMLVVDDCSRDETVAVVGRISAEDSRVRLIRSEKNGGPAAARNGAINAARGRYVAFLDSDDLWLPEKLTRQLDFMKANNAAFSFTQFRRISETGETYGRLVNVPTKLGYYDLLKNTAIATSTVIVDRDATGPFQMKKTYYDDYVLWLELTKRGFPAHGLKLDLMRYRVVGQSVSRNKLRSAKMVWITYRQVEGFDPIRSSWYLANYALKAVWKYARF